MGVTQLGKSYRLYILDLELSWAEDKITGYELKINTKKYCPHLNYVNISY